MNRFFLLALAALLPAFAFAEKSAEGSVKIIKPWIRALPGVARDTAAYFTIENLTDTPLRLTGGSTEVAEMVHAMISKKTGEGAQAMTGMEIVDELEIPAHGKRVLAPGGDHLMLMGLKTFMAAGARVPVVLHFQPGELRLLLDVPILAEEPR